MLAELDDEDIYSNANESQRMRRRLLLSANISELTGFKDNQEEYYEYEILGNMEYYMNGKMLLVFIDM